MDSEWVHDRFEDDRYDRMHKRLPAESDRNPPGGRPAETGTKLRVDNVHYDLTEDDLRELFERIGPVLSVKVQYDRHDRSTGTAFVTYGDHRDARAAQQEYDGQNANGMPIKLAIVPTEPRNAAPSAPRGGGAGSLFDRIERPPRSLFDRMESARVSRDDSREDVRRRRRERSDSPRKSRPAPDGVDRYVPTGARSRSPIRRRGTPRESGRRTGPRREENGRGPRGARADADGHALVGGRPRKTAQELDAEMEDYWGSKGAEKTNGTTAGQDGSNATATNGDDDIDMIE